MPTVAAPVRLYLRRRWRTINADAVIAIGGTGSGRNDASVRTLARLGRVDVARHCDFAGRDRGVRFCRRAAGAADARALDAVLAVWLLIGRHIVARLAGGTIEDGADDAAAETQSHLDHRPD